MPKNKLINLTENTNIIPIKNLIIKGYSYKEILESINNVKKAKTAAAVTAGIVGTGIGTGIALKGISKNDLKVFPLIITYNFIPCCCQI